MKWREVFDVWLKESEWSRSGEAPSIDEYLRVGTVSVAVQAMFLPACYLASPNHPQNSPGSRYSKITELLMLSSRLLNDSQGYEVILLHHHNFFTLFLLLLLFSKTDAESFQREMKDGKLNMVPLYLKENPRANIEDSIAYIKNKLERHKIHLLEIIMSGGYGEVPKEWKLLHLCALKGFQMLYNNFNAFDSPTSLLQNINMAIYEPLVMDVQRTLLPPFVLDAHEPIRENTGESVDSSPDKEMLVMTEGQLQGVN